MELLYFFTEWKANQFNLHLHSLPALLLHSHLFMKWAIFSASQHVPWVNFWSITVFSLTWKSHKDRHKVYAVQKTSKKLEFGIFALNAKGFLGLSWWNSAGHWAEHWPFPVPQIWVMKMLSDGDKLKIIHWGQRHCEWNAKQNCIST